MISERDILTIGRVGRRKGQALSGGSVVAEIPKCQANVGTKGYLPCGKKMKLGVYAYECPKHGEMH